MNAKVLVGDICDNCKYKSSQVLYSACCTVGANQDKLCIDVSVCNNYSKKD